MNKYSRVRQIGEGAFGKAILVKRRDSSKQAVIKEVNITRMSAKEREQARKEVAVLAQLKHPNIVAYIESFEEKGSLYIVMNYCSGGDLFGKINERRGQLFTEDQILDWFVQLCLAVKHIHDRKILHRDIKCQNIFLTQAGTVQLGDFGIAKVLSSTVQLAHTCIGTPYYLSPEIVENMPYNNKSDIWSIGCVLYEVTTLKHAFEAANMKNLVLKIIRGSYPPISPQFSYDLRGLIAQLFKRNPRDRPSVNAILRKNFVMQRVRRLLSAQDLADEFSHTVMHGLKIAKALPPAPKPSADPVKMAQPATPRPGSANRKYDPAAVYGVPINSSKNRLSGEQKKRPSTPGRQLPVPGQLEWEKKKKERQDAEQRRKAEIKKREQEINERKLRDYVERQKVAKIQKAREEGWKNVISPFPVDEASRIPTPSHNQPYSPRPLPVPKPNQQKLNKERGNYEAYNEYLDKLNRDQQAPVQDPRQVGNSNHIDVVHMAAPRPQMAAGPPQWSPAPKQQFNMGPLGVPVPAAIDQAGRDRQLGAQAAHRARVVEDYMQRQKQAALNKMRAQHDLFGVYRPMSADRRTPVPAPRRGSSPKNGQVGGGGDNRRGGGLVGRDREEQEYLEKLRQIRMQNMRDRGGVPRANLADDASRGQGSPDLEERRRKVDALKVQAEHWAEVKKNEVKQQRQQGKPPTPAPAVPMTGALNAIGAADKAQQEPILKDNEKLGPVPLTNALQVISGVMPARVHVSTESDRPKSALQLKKDQVLKKFNEKNPSRSKWGTPASPAIAAIEDSAERGKWGSPASPSIRVTENQEEAQSARAQWGDGKDLHLSKLALESTGSAMEATSLEDGVIKMAAESQSNNSGEAKVNQERGRWDKKSNFMLLDILSWAVMEDTVTISDPSQPETPVPPVGIGSTVVITSHKSDVQGKTTTSIKATDKSRSPVEVQKQIPSGDQLPPERSSTVVLSRKYSAGSNIPVVDEPDSSQKTETDGSKEPGQKTALWNTKNLDCSRLGATSVQMNLTNGNFDLKHTELLRTCSEPDLTQLSHNALPLGSGEPNKGRVMSLLMSTLRRHHSLDLTSVKEDETDDVGDADDFSEEDINIADENDDDDAADSDVEIYAADSNGGNEADEEDEDLKNLRETMQSILDDEDSEEKDKTLTNQQLPNNEDTPDSDHKTNVTKQVATKKDENDISEADACVGWSDETRDEDGEKEDNFLITLDFGDDDSDDETIFGDEDGDNDRFGRLEELRKDLETELGVEKLVEVYETVQKLQEDEAGNIEDDAKLALELLGPEKQHLFSKIFQLVMSDIAFTEG